MKTDSQSIFSIDKSSLNIEFQDSSAMKKQQQTLSRENDVVEVLSQIDMKSQSMSSSSISYKNISGLLRSLPQEKIKEEKSDERQKGDLEAKIQRRKHIEENQRKCLLKLIEKKNKNGRHNKQMTQQLIPDLESKIEQNIQNSRKMRLQEQNNKKYAIIGFKAYKMKIKEKVELMQIIQQYKQSSSYFHAEPRKKLLIFIYNMIYLIESVKLLSVDQCTLQYKKITKQMSIKNQQQIKKYCQKYEIMGNQIYHKIDKQKQQFINIIKCHYDSKSISPVHKQLILSQVSQMIQIIQSKEGQSSIQDESQQEKVNIKEQLIQYSRGQIKTLYSIVSAMILLLILRLFY